MTDVTWRERAQSGFPVVNKLVAILEALPGRDRAKTQYNARYAVHALAEECGFHSLRTPEEKEIASAMERIFCGPRSAHYGWRLYARYRQCGELNPLNITY